ncbi:hypothetical protein ACOME3_004314 [Neoechinorhynchus agilis]
MGVILSIAIIFTSMLGFIAVVSNKRWVLYLHSAFIIGVCTAQILATIIMMINRQSILRNQLKLLTILHKRANRTGSLVSRHIVYTIQKAFSCCGIESVESLDNFNRIKCKAGKEGIGITKTLLSMISSGTSAHNVIGCGPRISAFFYRHVTTIAVFSFLFVFIQVTCAIISMSIALFGNRTRS